MAEPSTELEPVPVAADGMLQPDDRLTLEGFEVPPPSATEVAIGNFARDAVQRITAGGFRGDLLFATGIVAILVVLILPMPKWLLDLSLAFSITFSVLILMTVIFMDRPLELTPSRRSC